MGRENAVYAGYIESEDRDLAGLKKIPEKDKPAPTQKKAPQKPRRDGAEFQEGTRKYRGEKRAAANDKAEAKKKKDSRPERNSSSAQGKKKTGNKLTSQKPETFIGKGGFKKKAPLRGHSSLTN